MTNLEEGLLGRGKKQNKEYKRRFEQCQLKVMTLRNKNNELQKQSSYQLDSDIRKAIRQQTAFLEIEINDLKDVVEGLTRDFTDPQSRNRIRQLWGQTAREIDRNKRIMQEFVNKSSIVGSMIKRSGISMRESRLGGERNLSVMQPIQQESNEGSLMGQQLTQQEIEMDQQMLAERGQLLRELQEKNVIINRIMNEMGEMLGQQGEMVDQMETNMQEAVTNVVETNEQLSSAIVYQKKSKRKYICLVLTIIVVMLVAAGLIYFLVPK